MKHTSLKTAGKSCRYALMALGSFAIVFGLLTIGSGGRVLFGGAQARQAAGNYVPFVLEFNFLAGFVYVAAGLATLRAHRWAAMLALGIASATALVFGLLGIFIAMGGSYEMRTVFAMSFRTVIWFAIAFVLFRVRCRQASPR